MKIFGCHGNEFPIKEILYQSVFGDKHYMIGHKFTISVTMDVSPFAWCLARAVLNLSFTDSIEANVEHAEIHVSEGTQQLRKARDYQVYTNPFIPKFPLGKLFHFKL